MCLKYAGLKYLFRKALSTTPTQFKAGSQCSPGFELIEILPTLSAPPCLVLFFFFLNFLFTLFFFSFLFS